MPFESLPVGNAGEVANEFLSLTGRIASTTGGGGDLLGVRKRAFSAASVVTITHGMPYPPMVWIVVSDSLVQAEIRYPDVNTLRVVFCQALTGTIYWR